MGHVRGHHTVSLASSHGARFELGANVDEHNTPNIFGNQTVEAPSTRVPLQRCAKSASPARSHSLVLGPTAKTLAQKLSADQWAPACNMWALKLGENLHEELPKVQFRIEARVKPSMRRSTE
jgi:hypothetical protein